MAIQIQSDKFEDDIMSELADKNSSSAVEFLLNRCLYILESSEKMETKSFEELKNSFDELKRSIQDEDQQTLGMDELQNVGFMSGIIKSIVLLKHEKTMYSDLKSFLIDDKMKRSIEDTEKKHFDGDEKQQVQKLAEIQNPRSMCYVSFRSIDYKHSLSQTKISAILSKHYSLRDDEEQINTINQQQWENEPGVILEFTQPLAKDEKTTSKLHELFTSSHNLNKHKLKETKSISYPIFEYKRKKIARHVSFVVLLSIIFGGLSFDMWIQPSLMKAQHVSIWVSLLGLLGFMVFVWAVAIMILLGVPFIGIQCAVLIFWVILMHLKSYNTISVMFVPIAGIVFFEVFARGKV